LGFLSDLTERIRKDLAADPPDAGSFLLRIRTLPPARDFDGALRGPGMSLIAEVKQASPSAGDIAEVDVGAQAERYERGGAAAISVLTEARHFKGSLTDLRLVRRHTSLPLLRKDFLVHPAQILESRANGADAVLLIAAALTATELEELLSVCSEVGLAALVEAHTQADLDKVLASAATIVGVNARDLETLEMDPARALALAGQIPAGRTVVLESGISSRRQVDAAAEAGVNAVLVGEALMRSADPAVTIRKLIGSLRPVDAVTAGED